MKRSRSLNPLFIILCALTLALVVYPAITSAQPNGLQAAWERAREAGAYDFIADIEQTLIPRPLPSMIGQTDQRVDMRIEGEVASPDYARLQLRFEGGGLDAPPLELIQDGAETYLLKDGEHIPVENPAGLSSPTADYLGYLAAAENIQSLPSPEIGGGAGGRYAYDINGHRFAEYVRDQMEEQLSSELPPDVTLSLSPLLQRMTGHGELWVDANGLPRRQVVDLEIPEITQEYDARIHLVVDFDFGQAAAALSASSLSNIQYRIPSIPISDALSLLLCLALATALITSGRRRWVYAVIAVTVSVIMVASPLLQVDRIVRFQARLAEAAESTQSIAEALGLDTTAPEEHQSPIPNTLSPSLNLQLAAQDPQSQCGSGAPGEDTDNDGLDDVTEYCLGTDPYYGDSDRDMITDTLEIAGFDFGGRTWPSDPFKPDSNNDGLADMSEWPAPVGEAPNFDDVDDWDPDGDGVPNLWDADNDGDNVPDSLDLSPFSRTDYTDTFALTTQGGSFGGYQYIEVQLQPQNQDHLRYTTTSLDWPHDEKGQIQDLDDSTDDLRLIPMLKILTNQPPDTELARKYGVSTFENDDGSYDLYAPLMPVGDGTQIVAFYSKVAYGPDELADIRWESAQMIWMVQADTNRYGGSTIIQTYAEGAVRVTGLQITKSQDSESAILGTPDSPEDDQQLFNVLFGLSATFLNNQTPDLQTVHQRFDNPNTDIVETWGVPSQDVAIDLAAYGHTDEGLADLRTRIPQFLDQYPTDSTPSLIIALQEEVGLYSIDYLEQLQPAASFNINLETVDMGSQRSLKRVSYRYESDGWEAVSLEDTLAMVQERYDDLSGTLADLHAQYPELTEHDLEGTLFLFYSVSYVGQTRVIAINGQVIAPEQRPDRKVYDQYNQPADTLLAYLIEAVELGEPGGGLRIGADQAQTWTYQRDNEELSSDLGIGGVAADFYDFGKSLLPDDKARFIANSVLKSVKTTLAILTAVQCIQWATSGRYFGVTGWTKASRSFGWASRMKLSIRILGAIGLIISLAVIWVQFGLITDWNNPLAVKQTVTYAVVATVFTVLLFIISLNPIGAILVMILVLVDLIVYFATGGELSIMAKAITAVAEFFYEVNELTYLDDADFVSFDTALVNPEMGLIKGSRLQVAAKFVGDIGWTSDGTIGDVEDSYVYGQFRGSAIGATAADKNSGKSCSRRGDCSNDVKVEYLLNQDKRNVQFNVEAFVRAKVYYEECYLGGLLLNLWCDRESQYHDLPEDLDEEDQWGPMTFYLDVLPDSLEGLWNWSEITNPDWDGDGLPDNQEASLVTYSDNWDSDGDGLSDKFEFDSQESLGTHPLNADTDDDDLSDGFEFHIGTRIDNPDSDGDGLTDGEEVYHQAAGGQWVGGWEVSLPGSVQTAWVFSNPLDADADADGLDDFTERANSTSPYAYNDAPLLTLDADPLAVNPNGAIGAYVEPGDTVVMTLTLDSVGPRPVTSTLTLCLPDFLTDLQGGDLRGDRNPPRQPAPDCNGFQWSFDGEYTLQLWETVSTTVTTTVESGLSASVSDEAVASLPYQVRDEPEDITTRVPVVVDVDNPEAAIVAPADGALLGGGISSYVIGGSANDATSWVTRVDLALPVVGTVTAEGISPWAYTWELPADDVYVLTATSYDHLGHASTPATVQVTVDNTAPEVDLDLADGGYLSGQSGKVITINLTGSASDNLSGLTRVQVSTDGRPWREVWAVGGYPLAANWSTDWTLPDEESAQGKHTVSVRAFDQAGNESDTLERTIIVDVVPPTDELTSRTYLSNPPHNPTGQLLTFHGVANDAGNVPQPSRPAELVGELDGISDATIWLGLSSIDENDAGVQVAWLGDYNGDRLADLAVGLPAAADGDGQVTVVYGRAGGWQVPSDLEMLAESRTSFVGETGAGIGGSLAAAGDVDGDGFNDLLIGDAANDRIYLVFGRPSPLGRNLLLDEPQPAIWSVLTAPDGEQIGEWLGAAGDVNGDGYDDLLIGATGAEGKAYLLLGQSPPWWETVELAVHAAAVISTDAAGARLTGVGDMDNDQNDEFAVADGNTVHLFEGRGDFAPRAGQSLALDDAISTFASSDVRPAVAALGDVNNDQMADFIYANGDQPQVVFGDENQTWTVQAITGHTPAPSGFLAAPGDVDADGLDDLLIGNADDDAYLILGKDLDTVEATLTGVETAASAPYAAGADINSDGSSDLLLVPTEAAAADKGLARLSFGETPYVSPQSLPVARINNTQYPILNTQHALLATAYVDDDGCGGQSPCYTTIQAAIDAAGAGDNTINVLPGVYAAFTISGTGKNNLTVSGVHPDAVFVDGASGVHAVKIQNATGVTLEKLTLRDADYGVHLDGAGVGGYDDPSLITTLQSLLIYDFGQHAVYMDRTSSASLAHCTIAGGDNHIEVYGDPAFEANWAVSMAGQAATNGGGGIVAGEGKLYTLPGDGSDAFYRYEPLTSNWATLASVPVPIYTGSAAAAGGDGNLYVLPTSHWSALGSGASSGVNDVAIAPNGDLYVTGGFNQAGGVSASCVARWDGTTWAALGSGLTNSSPGDLGGMAIAIADDSAVYVGGVFDTAGGNSANNVAKWNGSNWTALGAGLPDPVHAIAVDSNGTVYAGNNSTTLGGYDPDFRLAKWNGSGWTNMITDDNDHIAALAIDENDNVYVGGYLNISTSSGNARNIARWNGSNWEKLGAGVNSGVESVAIGEDGDVYVGGGHITEAGSVSVNNIAKWNGSNWEALGGGLNDYVFSIAVNHGYVYAGGEFTQAGGKAAHRMARWDGSSWFPLSDGVSEGVSGAFYTTAYSIAVHDGDVYVGGRFSLAGSIAANHIARWEYDLYRYNVPGNSWDELSPSPRVHAAGATLTSDGADYLYALAGGDTAIFYRYDLNTDTWQQRADLPGNVNAGGALAWANGYAYAFRGGGSQDFCRYTPGSNSWDCALEDAPCGIYAGASLAWDDRDWIYALAGGNGIYFLRYYIPTGQWQILGDGSSATGDDDDTPLGVNAGGGLVYVDQALYGIPGGGEGQLWSYDPVGIYPEKLTLDQTAFVVPDTAATATWFSMEGVDPYELHPQPDDFMLVGNGNAWVGGSTTTWSPDPSSDPPLSGSSQLTHDQAQFVDAARDVYRIRADSTLNAGYHTYRATAYVAPSGEEFTNIQDAILSDANTVVVKPGQYPQPFYLISGVNVLGSRADQTILEPPPGHTTPLVTAEGVVGARLSGFTLAGDGNQDGLRVEDGAQSITFGRNIVRGTETGIAVLGDDTDLEVVNNTIVDNTNGMVASACAPVDVRNTIFAYNQDAGLASSLVAHWRLDEDAGATTFADASGNGHTGACSGGNCPTAGESGEHDGALLFDGGDDYVDVPHHTRLTPAALTVAAWIKADAWADEYWEGVIVSKEDWEAASRGYSLRTGESGRLSFVLSIGGTWQEALSGQEMSDGTWVHVAGTYDGSAVKVFVNGQEKATTPYPGAITPSTYPLNIGRSSYATDRLFNGLVDDVRIYDRALSADEVLALSGDCSPAYLHTYNDFWANGTDLSPAEPGAGEMFLDPMFVDRFAHDYRTLDGSPVIDAGNPSDPAPPGTGDRVDIGYIEQGRAAFYADDDYCETCPNDGLTWQVDAFDKIQDALDAAADDMAALEATESPPQYTVGVGPGAYNEQVTIPGYVRLVGSGAEDTTINAGGSGSPVTFAGVVQAEVTGFTLTGAGSPAVAISGASNAITITRNIIEGNPTGVAFSERATGLVTFNTLVNNSEDGISSSGTASWVEVENNILSDNGTGLNAASDGQIFSNYNLLDNTTNYSGVAQGDNDVVGQDPNFQSGTYRLTAGSPAVDAASPFAEVPAGGGERADLGYRELLAAPVSVFLGKEDVSTATGNSGVSEVEVGVTLVADPSQPVTDTLPSTWNTVPLDSPGETASYWQTDYTPGQEGLHRFYSRATDVVGNQESDEDDWYEGAFVADYTPPVVTWLEPANGTTLSSPLELRAEVSDYAAGEFSVEDIHFEVDGDSYAAEWAAEPWDEENEEPRVFRAWVSLADEDYNAVAVAEDKAVHVGQSTPIAFTVSGQSAADTTLPNLVITSPAAGGWVTSTVTFSGTASDGESGLASVEVSVDGGYTWLPATVNGADWELTWDAPEGQEFVSYPAWVRASDQAGNSISEARVFTVDNVAPTGLAPLTFSAPQGTHFDATTTLTITWNTPVDGSGTAIVLLAVDQISDTTPTQQVPGTTATVPLALSGDWYVHLGAKDAAGNQFTRHFGSWHVGTFGDSGTPFDQRQQSIVIDGYLDLEAGEWLTSTEFLDDDERPLGSGQGSGERQSFYATWDGEAFYLGWQGAWWTLDGTLWAYLDTGPGGSNEAIGIAATLPFDADYAIEVASPTDGTLWHYNGDWQPAALDPSPGSGQGFAQGESGDTEVRLLLSTAEVSDLQLIAFALDDDDQVWSIFPTTNPLNPSVGGSLTAPMALTQLMAGTWPDAYEWDDLTSIANPNAGQPQATSVEMALSSPQAPQAAWGPGNLLEYVVDLTNQEASEVAGLQLAFSTTTGLAYQTVDGATCADCTADDNWLLNVPPLAAGASHRVTVTGQLAADLSGLSSVTTTVALKFDAATLDEASLSHRVDGQPPTVSVSRAGETIRPGLQTIYGQASDGDGVGVGSVQARQAGTGTWQDASGTLLWSCEVDVPLAPTFQLEAQAKDQHDQTSDVVLAEFTVDAVPPAVNWSLPAILSGVYAEIGGTTADPYPVGGEVNQVEVQLDQDTIPWQVAQVYAPNATGSQNWLWTWALPHEDGVIHTLRVRATDVVSNTSPASDWQSTLVDTVAPVVTVATVISDVVLGDYQPGSVTGQPVLEGTASDGDSVSDVFVHVNLPDGDSYQAAATLGLSSPLAKRRRTETRNGSEWSYTPELTQCGHHTLRLEVTDRAGNASLEGAFDLFVDAPGFTAAFVTAEPSNSISLTARVSNDGGKQAAAGVSVAFYLGDPEAGGTLIGTAATTQALNPGEWEDVTFTWDTAVVGDHDIYVVADDDGTGASQIPECEENNNTTHHIVSILDVPLVESWNLMSAYVNPFNTDASVVQLPIAGQYVVIQGFDGGAQSYYPDLPPEVNTLKDMDAEHGYWIKTKPGGGSFGSAQDRWMTADGAANAVATLRVVGEKLAEDQAIDLDAGWNLVGYLPRQPLAVQDALQSIDGHYTAVLGYDQGALSYYPDIDPSFNTLHEMVSPFGYWIKMALSATLQYPTTVGDQALDIGHSRSPTPDTQYLISNIREAEQAAGVTPTHTWVNFYGPAHLPDETPLPVGTTVLALDPNGVVCGATVVTHEGQYGLLACYGDDPTTPEDEGAQAGDTTQLVVDGQVLATGTWTAHGNRQWRPLGKADLWELYLPLIRKGEDGRWKEEDGRWKEEDGE